MAHEIDTSTGNAAVFTAGAPPWHGLGQNVAEAVSSAQAIQLAGLDWLVEQWPVSAFSPDGSGPIAAEGFLANVRADTRRVLGVVTKKYKPFQNHQAFAFCDGLVGDGLARYETGGALRGGRRVWMLLKLPDEIRAGPDDRIQPFVLVYNTFDSSSCLRALLTSIRVVCQNTLNLALDRAGGVTIRHRGDLHSHVDEARMTLGLMQRRLKNFSREIERFRSVSMTKGRLKGYFQSLLPALGNDAGEKKQRNRERALDQLNANFSGELNSLPGMRRTLWAALNSATEFADHQRRFRGTGGAGRAENRLDSIWFGSSAEFKSAAYRSALELAALN